MEFYTHIGLSETVGAVELLTEPMPSTAALRATGTDDATTTSPNGGGRAAVEPPASGQTWHESAEVQTTPRKPKKSKSPADYQGFCSGGHETRTRNPLRGTTFPVWPLANSLTLLNGRESPILAAFRTPFKRVLLSGGAAENCTGSAATMHKANCLEALASAKVTETD
jgi:hypothetical protein